MCHSKSVASGDALFRSAVDFDEQFRNCSVMDERELSAGLLDGFAVSNSSSFIMRPLKLVLCRLNRRRIWPNDQKKRDLRSFASVVELELHV